jgi:hypothetical protein
MDRKEREMFFPFIQQVLIFKYSLGMFSFIMATVQVAF